MPKKSSLGGQGGGGNLQTNVPTKCVRLTGQQWIAYIFYIFIYKSNNTDKIKSFSTKMGYIYILCTDSIRIFSIPASSIGGNGNPLILKHVQIGGQQPCVPVKVQELLQQKRKFSRKLQSIRFTDPNLWST